MLWHLDLNFCRSVPPEFLRSFFVLPRPAHRIFCGMWKVCVFIAKFTIFLNVVVITKITNMSNCFVWKPENIDHSITDWQVQGDKSKNIACATYISSNIQHKTGILCSSDSSYPWHATLFTSMRCNVQGLDQAVHDTRSDAKRCCEQGARRLFRIMCRKCKKK